MKQKYCFTAECTITLLTQVIAESEEEARAILEDRENTNLWRTDQDDLDEYWCSSGELDGPAKNIELSSIELVLKRRGI